MCMLVIWGAIRFFSPISTFNCEIWKLNLTDNSSRFLYSFTNTLTLELLLLFCSVYARFNTINSTVQFRSKKKQKTAIKRCNAIESRTLPKWAGERELESNVHKLKLRLPPLVINCRFAKASITKWFMRVLDRICLCEIHNNPQPTQYNTAQYTRDVICFIVCVCRSMFAEISSRTMRISTSEKWKK